MQNPADYLANPAPVLDEHTLKRVITQASYSTSFQHQHRFTIRMLAEHAGISWDRAYRIANKLVARGILGVMTDDTGNTYYPTEQGWLWIGPQTIVRPLLKLPPEPTVNPDVVKTRLSSISACVTSILANMNEGTATITRDQYHRLGNAYDEILKLQNEVVLGRRG